MKRCGLLVLLAALLLAAPAGAQEFSPFLFKDMVDWRLYPEVAVEQNPSVILDIERLTLFPTLDISMSGYKSEDTRPEGHPLEGGTDSYKEREIDPFVGIEGYIPIGENMAAGGMLSFDPYRWKEEEEWKDYGAYAAVEDVTEEDENKYRTIRGGGAFATGLWPVELGAALFFSNYKDPAEEEYNQISGDPATTETYTTELFNGIEKRNIFGGAVGARYTRDAMTAGLGVTLSIQTEDLSEWLIAVDKNLDGFDESIVDYEEYLTSTEPWGLGLPYYDYLDETKTTVLAVYPSLTYELSPTIMLIATGFWIPLAKESETYYLRTTSTDKSETTGEYNYGFRTGGLMGGVELRPSASLAVRVGLGYEHYGFKFSQEILDATGSSTFDPNNKDKYTEVAYGVGTGPDNDEVIWDAGLIPTKSSENDIVFLTGAKWNPADNVQLFGNATLDFMFWRDVYHVYDTDNNVVWEEVDKGRGLDWTLDALFGLAVRLSERLVIATTAEGIYSEGYTIGWKDSLPESSSPIPVGTAVDLTEGSVFDFTLTISGALEL
jgi:opacity protein-like surface antigen